MPDGRSELTRKALRGGRLRQRQRQRAASDGDGALPYEAVARCAANVQHVVLQQDFRAAAVVEFVTQPAIRQHLDLNVGRQHRPQCDDLAACVALDAGEGCCR